MKGKEIYTTFTKDNVLAILAARKWQTRRVIKPQPRIYTAMHRYNRFLKWKNKVDAQMPFALEFLKRHCRWQPGDLLCVKEGYQIDGISGEDVHGRYLADDEPFDVRLTDAEWERWVARKHPYRATSARFMYRSLCRIKQPVVRSWVERVQDISPADCEAESITGLTLGAPGCGTGILLPYEEYRNGNGLVYGTLREAFCALWDEINAHRGHGWDANPWVWAVQFERRAQ